MYVEFRSLRFDLPTGWAEITDDLPSGSPPTLARPGGIGAIQFSTAQYRTGDKPNITIDVLRTLLEEFCHRNLLEHSVPVERNGVPLSVHSTSITDEEVVSVCYLSNGKDIAFVTYVCSRPNDPALKIELEDMQRIVETASL